MSRPRPWKHDPLAVPCVLPSQSAHTNCGDCVRWEFRLLVALRTGYELALRIDQVELRGRVVDHVAVGWWQRCQVGGHPEGFAGFFRDYLTDVERDADENAHDLDWELHRVWTNHASVLGSEMEMVCRRPER